MRGRIPIFITCAFISALAAGCAVSGTVVDAYDKRTELTKMSLSSGDGFLLYDGNGTRSVGLAEVEKILLFPHETRTVDGRLFYLAVVTFAKNGLTIGASRVNADDDKIFVAIDSRLSGEAAGGRFEIPLDRVAEIIID